MTGKIAFDFRRRGDTVFAASFQERKTISAKREPKRTGKMSGHAVGGPVP